MPFLLSASGIRPIMSHLQELKVKTVSCATFSSSKDQGTENSPGLEGSMRGRPGYSVIHRCPSRLRNGHWQRCLISQATCSPVNYPKYWKDFPNICPRASLKFIIHLVLSDLTAAISQPKSGPPPTRRKGIGWWRKAGPYLALCACRVWRGRSVFRLSLQNLTEGQTPFVYVIPGCLSVASWALDLPAV